eukprot:gnl/TRDRNA2_/TRDRNA2_95659_c0_seq1.p1 gnl/TRDRNA2_/TRDRNA2_95659_c0~~gnl/TRDRNA2_/TRDRNA2_95659_c0_seq1.p1  ORF type:complete len:176 (+),score=44.86 gnl/TRDRNA2_/TRDRNA2_95659_c0_seq1:35-529(+)
MSYFQAIQLDVSDAAFIYRLIDVDQSESVSIEEFCVGVHRLRGPAKCLDVVHLLTDCAESKNALQSGLQQIQQALAAVLEGETAELQKEEETQMELLGVSKYLHKIGVIKSATDIFTEIEDGVYAIPDAEAEREAEKEIMEAEAEAQRRESDAEAEAQAESKTI